jgi:hypothetical protein
MYYLFIVLWSMFSVVVDSNASMLDNLQDLQADDFERF